LAAKWAGIETVAFCEIEPFCQKVLRKNFGADITIFDDVRNVTTESLRGRGVGPESISVVAGGFPCQPFSLAGGQLGTADDRYLWPEMFRVIQSVNPAWVVAENVPRIISIQRELVFQTVLTDLEGAGYETLPPLVYPACGVGANHRRNRVFFVAHSRDSGFGQLLQPERQPQRQPTPDARRNGAVQSLAYSDGQRELQPQGCEREQRGRPSDGGQDDADADSARLQKRDEHRGFAEAARGIDARSEPFGVYAARDWRQWEIEPAVGRVADGIPRRVDRLRGLGNAVVPQQVYPIFEAIANLETNAA
jgi:DNA (cytosine-5)-methyltransferase 1